MNMTRIHRLVSLILCVMLVAAPALTLTGCTDTKTPTVTSPETAVQGETVAPTVRGEGSTVFTFTVVDADGQSTTFEIHTDKTVVGEALQELGLIAGDEGAYGLYVKTVNGITVDYDTDKAYWAFYENGQYALSGVDTTDITPGVTYSLRVEKG